MERPSVEKTLEPLTNVSTRERLPTSANIKNSIVHVPSTFFLLLLLLLLVLIAIGTASIRDINR